MTLSAKEIRELLEILEASGWDEAQVVIGDVTLTVSKNGVPGTAAPATPASPPGPAGSAPPPPPAAAPPTVAPAAPASPAPEASHVVAAPSLGVFWRSPEPGAPPFVDVGDTVAPGDTLCIVEVMKLMNQVVADTSGVVTAIYASNGDSVEFGAPLFGVEPAA